MQALPTFARSTLDQLRMHALSPMAVFSTLGIPSVFAVVIHSAAPAGRPARGATTELAVGTAGIGMVSSMVAILVISLLGEKQWRALYAALGSPSGLTPVILGRLAGMTVQSLVALPGTLVVLVALFRLDSHFSWTRWLAGGVLLAVSTASVAALLCFVVLRYPYSPGMTNGIPGLLVAVSALVVPASALPGPVRAIARILPQPYVMQWVRGGGAAEVGAALAIAALYCCLVVLAVRRVEATARRKAIPLEM